MDRSTSQVSTPERRGHAHRGTGSTYWSTAGASSGGTCSTSAPQEQTHTLASGAILRTRKRILIRRRALCASVCECVSSFVCCTCTGTALACGSFVCCTCTCTHARVRAHAFAHAKARSADLSSNLPKVAARKSCVQLLPPHMGDTVPLLKPHPIYEGILGTLYAHRRAAATRRTSSHSTPPRTGMPPW